MEIPLTIVAWISVVVIQAIVHYLILGKRRERYQHEEDKIAMEEMSLSTTTEGGSMLSLTTTSEGSMDLDEPMFGEPTVELPADVSASGTQLPPLLGDKTTSTSSGGGGGGGAVDETEKVFMEFLGQTGKELFRVSYTVLRGLLPITYATPPLLTSQSFLVLQRRSVERIVEEQVVRARTH